MATTLQERVTTDTKDETYRGTMAWILEKRRILLGAAAVVVVVLLGVWFFTTATRRKEAFAMQALSNARSTAESGNLPQASTQLQQVISTYPGTDAAHEAELSLNQVRLINNQAELAVVRLREFVSSNPGTRYVMAGNALLGAALENTGKAKEAADAYEAAASAADVGYLKAGYLIEAARAWEDAGQKDTAVATLRRVVEKYPDTDKFTEAQIRLAELTGGRM